MRRTMTGKRVTIIRRMLSVSISMILMAGICIGCAEGTEQAVMTVLRADAIPAREWQKTAAFPDWRAILMTRWP